MKGKISDVRAGAVADRADELDLDPQIIVAVLYCYQGWQLVTLAVGLAESGIVAEHNSRTMTMTTPLGTRLFVTVRRGSLEGT